MSTLEFNQQGSEGDYSRTGFGNWRVCNAFHGGHLIDETRDPIQQKGQNELRIAWECVTAAENQDMECLDVPSSKSWKQNKLLGEIVKIAGKCMMVNESTGRI